MSCVFLKETEVRFCELVPFRKWIQRVPLSSDGEICSGPGWIRCPQVAKRLRKGEKYETCPYLRHKKMLFCSAEPAPRLIPYSDSLVSRCQCDAYRYCDTYLSIARPRDSRRPPRPGTTPCGWDGADWQASPDAPDHLHYASNHMWLDSRPDGTAVVGLDALLLRILGRPESVTFMNGRGIQRPAVDLTVRGVDMQMIFPNPVELTEVNLAVLEDPGRIEADPYLEGWLFMGRSVSLPDEVTGSWTASGLLEGCRAGEWMRGEWDRAVRFFHAWLGAEQAAAGGPQCDGGSPSGPMACHLDRAALLRLFNEFFCLRGGTEAP